MVINNNYLLTFNLIVFGLLIIIFQHIEIIFNFLSKNYTVSKQKFRN